jgi:hypothetical protein
MNNHNTGRSVIDAEGFRVLVMHRVNHIISTIDQIDPILGRKLTISNVHSQLHLIIDMVTALDKTIHTFTNEYYSRKEN